VYDQHPLGSRSTCQALQSSPSLNKIYRKFAAVVEGDLMITNEQSDVASRLGGWHHATKMLAGEVETRIGNLHAAPQRFESTSYPSMLMTITMPAVLRTLAEIARSASSATVRSWARGSSAVCASVL
jgi:hypothetical protein